MDLLAFAFCPWHPLAPYVSRPPTTHNRTGPELGGQGGGKEREKREKIVPPWAPLSFFMTTVVCLKVTYSPLLPILDRVLQPTLLPLLPLPSQCPPTISAHLPAFTPTPSLPSVTLCHKYLITLDEWIVLDEFVKPAELAFQQRGTPSTNSSGSIGWLFLISDRPGSPLIVGSRGIPACKSVKVSPFSTRTILRFLVETQKLLFPWCK